MSDEKAVASEFGGIWAHGSGASPEACESATELLDAVHRASFEAWWTRVHPARECRASAHIPTRRAKYPKN
jgi:hypothetical protein